MLWVFLFFGCPGSSWLLPTISLFAVSEQGLLFIVEHVSIVVVHGLSCSKTCAIFPNQGSNLFLCLGRQILIYCVTREFCWVNIFLKVCGGRGWKSLYCRHVTPSFCCCSVAQSWLSATPWTATHQASLSFPVSWSLSKWCPLSQWSASRSLNGDTGALLGK